MNEFSFSITFTTGALVGAMLAAPDEAASVYVVFTLVNAMISLVGYSVGATLFSFIRGAKTF